MTVFAYPDRTAVSANHDLTVFAIGMLSKFSIPILRIDLTGPAPHIEVLPCPGIKRLNGASSVGCGRDEHGEYVRFRADLKGAYVFWNSFTS